MTALTLKSNELTDKQRRSSSKYSIYYFVGWSLEKVAMPNQSLPLVIEKWSNNNENFVNSFYAQYWIQIPAKSRLIVVTPKTLILMDC